MKCTEWRFNAAALLSFVLSAVLFCAQGSETDPATKADEAALHGDYDTARKEWTRLAEQGDVRSQYNLAVMYDKGRGMPKDEALALKWYRRAAEKGHARAQNNLGTLYNNGRGVENYQAAMHWYRRAADQGLPDAQFNIGNMYTEGSGVPKDVEQASQWYEKAAKQGYAPAQHNLGVAYMYGRGVNRDVIRAGTWFETAAAKGYVPSQLNLAIMALKNPEDKLADRNAYSWYTIAIMGLRGEERTKANKARDEIAVRLTPSEIEETERLAIAWYRRHQTQNQFGK